MRYFLWYVSVVNHLLRYAKIFFMVYSYSFPTCWNAVCWLTKVKYSFSILKLVYSSNVNKLTKVNGSFRILKLEFLEHKLVNQSKMFL